MNFCTAVNCMDGRVQLPVIEYLKHHFDVTFIDTITEPGPNAILANKSESFLLQSIQNRIDISIKCHGSNLIAIVGHHDCAGNPTTKTNQLNQIVMAKRYLNNLYPTVDIIGLWVNEYWEVEEV